MHATNIGVIASKNEEIHEFFASPLYPYIYSDDMAVVVPTFSNGALWGTALEDAVVALPQLTAGTLTETITYKTYNETAAIEDLGVNLPALLNGTITETITYKTYNETAAIEDLGVNLPALLNGTLVTTISYVTYDSAAAIEDLIVWHPSFLPGGTLT